MTSATREEKIFFAVIFVSAIWIGVVGFLLPTQLAAVFTWLTLPPLHARFLGALYLFGAALMLACFLANRWTQVQAALTAAAIWTGLIFIVSVIHLSAFDLSQPGAWVWLGSYLIYALLGIWLAWNRSRRAPPAVTNETALTGWVRTYLLVQGGVMIVLALALLVAPAAVATVWPWAVSAQLAQFYSGPLLAYGFITVRFARAGSWADLRVLLPTLLVFTTCVLIASLLHLSLFSLGDISDWLWFGGFIVATVFLGAIAVRGQKNSGSTVAVPSAAH